MFVVFFNASVVFGVWFLCFVDVFGVFVCVCMLFLVWFGWFFLVAVVFLGSLVLLVALFFCLFGVVCVVGFFCFLLFFSVSQQSFLYSYCLCLTLRGTKTTEIQILGGGEHI